MTDQLLSPSPTEEEVERMGRILRARVQVIDERRCEQQWKCDLASRLERVRVCSCLAVAARRVREDEDRAA